MLGKVLLISVKSAFLSEMLNQVTAPFVLLAVVFCPIVKEEKNIGAGE